MSSGAIRAPAAALGGAFAGYAVAIVAIAGAALVQVELQAWWAGGSPYLLFAAAVLVVGVLKGVGPALFAATLGAILAMGLGWSSGAAGAADFASFVLVSASIIAVVLHSARRARRTRDLVDELNLMIDGATGWAMFMLDAAGCVSFWNKGAERLTGWSEAEILGRPAALFYPLGAIAAGEPDVDLAAARATGRLDEEGWRVRKDGAEFLAHILTTPFFDLSGRLRGYGRVIRDITEQRAREHEACANANHLRSILSTVPDAMVVINKTGHIMSFSAAAERLFGYSEAEAKGRNVSMLIPTADRDRHDTYLEHYLTTGERRIIGIGRTVVGQRRDGTLFPMELFVGEAITDDERIFTGFIHDLTEKHRMDERLEAMRADLIHAARVSAMGTMASTLAHEINQPITAIINYVRGIRNLIHRGHADDGSMIEEALADATREALRAGDIVRHLREFVSRGEVEKRIEQLPGLIEEGAKLALIGAREKGVAVSFDLDPSATPVLVDRVQIQQVLINLMRNAIEAMAQAPVRELRVSSRALSDGCVCVSVADTGPGVDPVVAEKLFRAFNSTKAAGMGLGLSICRTIVEANGGRIWMEPGTSGGSQFHFTLMRTDMEPGK
ncbi:MAG: PAS domain S-box protein [Sphingomonas sp.]|jgi:two-component system sensor kinase FixL